jgi:hypothetical protein
MPCFPGSGSRIMRQHRPLSTMNPGASPTRQTLGLRSDSNLPRGTSPFPQGPSLPSLRLPSRFRWGPGAVAAVRLGCPLSGAVVPGCWGARRFWGRFPVWAPLSRGALVGEGKAGHVKPPQNRRAPRSPGTNEPAGGATEPDRHDTAATPPEREGVGQRGEGGRALGDGQSANGRARGFAGPVEFDR